MLRMPDAQTILGLWEQAEHEHPIDRALSILSVFARASRSSLASLPIHRRDALLLASRVAAFGYTLEGVAACPGCGCKVDAALTLPAAAAVPSDDKGRVEVEGRAVGFRIPNSRDLAAAVRAPDAEAAGRMLLTRCQLASEPGEAVARAIDAEIERLCEASSLELKMACPQCSGEFVVPVDIASFFWDELVFYAKRLLEDVDALAQRYGWTEADVLSLPERRRRYYLEL